MCPGSNKDFSCLLEICTGDYTDIDLQTNHHEESVTIQKKKYKKTMTLICFSKIEEHTALLPVLMNERKLLLR